MSVATEYEIEHKCGHTEVKDLSAVPAGQRAGKAEWLTTRPCFECFKKSAKRKVSREVQAEREALRREAEEDQERSTLPLLIGSAKQVEWALTVRFGLLREAYESMVQSSGIADAEFEGRVLEPARKISAAKWWIDNREASPDQLAELVNDPGIEVSENENPY